MDLTWSNGEPDNSWNRLCDQQFMDDPVQLTWTSLAIYWAEPWLMVRY